MVGGVVLATFGAVLVAGAVLAVLLHLKFEPVLSGSMRPGIQPGDLAIIRPVPAADLEVGEIIAYLPPGQSTPVMHRIVSIDADGIVTKGDANNAADPWGRVKPHDPTVERLVTVIPKVGFLTDVKQLLLIVAGVLLILVAAIALWPSTNGAPALQTGSSKSEESPEESEGHNRSVNDDRDVADRSAMEINNSHPSKER